MDIRKRGRRPGSKNYTRAFREMVVAQTNAPGRSIAEVAHSHGLNANMISQWRRRAASGDGAGAPALLPVNIVEIGGNDLPVSPDVPVAAHGQQTHQDVAQASHCIDIDIEVDNRRVAMRRVPQALVEQLLREWLR